MPRTDRRLRGIYTALAPAAGGAPPVNPESISKSKPISELPWATTYTHSPRFLLEESDVAAAHLDEHGFTIFRGLLSGPECEAALDSFWGFFESLGVGIDRARSDSWGTEAANLVFTERV
eukprot:COSAG01_NODE_5591_length_4159_cov_59.059852_7_plen_120_part_00